MSLEENLNASIDKQIKFLHELLNDPTNEIAQLIRMQIEDFTKGPVDPHISEERLKKILKQYDNLDDLFAGFTRAVIPVGVSTGAEEARRIIKKYNMVRAGDGIDAKAIEILIRDSIFDFWKATKGGRKMAVTFFEFSKQNILTESQISLLVADGLISARNGQAAKSLISGAFNSMELPVFDAEQLAKFKKNNLNKMVKAIQNRTNINDGLKDWLTQNMIEKYKDEKFLQIINKNGDVMTFKVDTYSELVTRTRIGDSQVHGTIDESEAHGIHTFRVSSHNTLSAICEPHEDKIYTTNKKLLKDVRVDGMLDSTTRPLYHINCLHRLSPIFLVPQTEAQEKRFFDRKEARKKSRDEARAKVKK